MCWCVGVLVCWCVGVLVCWCVGVLVCWCGSCMMLVSVRCQRSLAECLAPRLPEVGVDCSACLSCGTWYGCAVGYDRL